MLSFEVARSKQAECGPMGTIAEFREDQANCRLPYLGRREHTHEYKIGSVLTVKKELKVCWKA